MITTKDMLEKVKGPVYLLPFTPANAVICHVLRRNRIEVLGFLDNNRKLRGGSYDGCPVLSVEEAVRRDPGASFIVTSANYAGVLTQQLKDAGVENVLPGERVIPPVDFYDAVEDMDEEAPAFLLLDLPGSSVRMARSAFGELLEKQDPDRNKPIILSQHPRDIARYYDIASRQLDFIPYVSWYDDFFPTEITSLLRHIRRGATPFGWISILCYFSTKNIAQAKAAYETLTAEGTDVALCCPGASRSSSKRPRIIITVEEPYSAFEQGHECAFIHIEKNAGTSMRDYFHTNHSEHRNASELARYNPALFSRSFSFTIVRNPWDRFVSLYHYYRGLYLERVGAPADARSFLSAESFPEAVRRLKTMPPERFRHYSQYRWVCDANDTILVDYIGRFEHINDSMDYITKKLGFVSDAPFPHANQSAHRPYTEVYDDEMIRIVGEAFKQDVELFGYEFGKQPGADIIVNPREDFIPVRERKKSERAAK